MGPLMAISGQRGGARALRRATLVLLAAAAPACIFDLADVVSTTGGGSGTTAGGSGAASGGGGAGGSGAASGGGAAGGSGAATGGVECPPISFEISPDNRAPNPSFEDSTSGWQGSGKADLQAKRTSYHVHGGSVAVVAYTGDVPAEESYFVEDSGDTIATPAAGALYRVTAWVRSTPAEPNPGARISVVLGTPDDDESISKGDKTEIGPCFTKIEASGIATAASEPIGVRVKRFGAVPGDAFEVDLIQVFEELPDAGSD